MYKYDYTIASLFKKGRRVEIIGNGTMHGGQGINHSFRIGDVGVLTGEVGLSHNSFIVKIGMKTQVINHYNLRIIDIDSNEGALHLLKEGF